jgi:hypothetical protein
MTEEERRLFKKDSNTCQIDATNAYYATLDARRQEATHQKKGGLGSLLKGFAAGGGTGSRNISTYSPGTVDEYAALGAYNATYGECMRDYGYPASTPMEPFKPRKRTR